MKEEMKQIIKKMKYIIPAILITVLAACNSKMEVKPTDDNQKDKQQQTDKQTDKKQDTKKDSDKPTKSSLNSDEAIVEVEPKMEYQFGQKYKNWTPGESDIATARKLLTDCITQERSGTVDHLLDKTLDDYNKQYIGAAEDNGEKVIWINCYCKKYEKDFPNWKTQIVHVADGGNCFFNVEVNITRNVFGLLIVNGGP